MQNYTIIQQIGAGAYGEVYKAIENSTNRTVAIKKLFQATSWSDAKSMVELKSFKQIKQHKNIVQLYELFREKDGSLYFVFEYISGGDLNDFIQRNIKAGTRPEYQQILNISYQILSGLKHIHDSRFVHRDLKQENILIQDGVPKIADLGCAKEIRGKSMQNTVYIGTRWYRSIELLLHDPKYSFANDIWSIACIISELFTLSPLFPGNSEMDMLNMITEQFGPISNNEYPEFQQLCEKVGFVQRSEADNSQSSPQQSVERIKNRLLNKLPGSTDQICDLLSHMFQLNPARRYTAAQCLNHPVFAQFRRNDKTVELDSLSHQSSCSASNKYNDVLTIARNALQKQRSSTIPSQPNNNSTYNFSNYTTIDVPKVQKSKELFQSNGDDIFANLDLLDQI